MKKLFSMFGITTVAVLFMQCSNKPKEMCECFKKAANTYMVKGERASEQDILTMCAEFEGAGKNLSMEDKRLCMDCLDTVKQHIAEKILFTDVEQISFGPTLIGDAWIKDLNAILNKIPNKKAQVSAINYYLKHRTLACTLAVAQVVSLMNQPTLYDGMIRVTGELYANGQLSGTPIEILLPPTELPNIKRAMFASEIPNNRDYFMSTYRQLIKFAGPYQDIGVSTLGGLIIFKADSFAYLQPNPATETATSKGHPRFIFAATNDVATTDNNAKDIVKEEFTADPEVTAVIGTYTGTFGKDQLTLKIESIQQHQIVGWDAVKGNQRKLTGTIKNVHLVLQEPGDDKWDGVFDMTYANNTLTGIWKANNGKSTKNFTLTKN